MKGIFSAAALAALAGAANAHNHRHAHDLFAAHKRNLATGEVCVPGCTTIWSTITGEPTLVPPQTTTTTSTLTSTTVATITNVPSAPPVVPTPHPTTCPTPGTYTFPATTITVTQTTTVCGATSTKVPSGTHTIGGVTTIVETATTVTCPVATVITSGSVTTSTLTSTTYVCPTPGTYTIQPITTTVTEETVIVYPVPTVYNPGTYTAPEQVVTVTKTGYVTYCPFTSSGLPSPTPAPETPKPAPPKPAPPAPKPTVDAPKPAPSKPATQPHGPLGGDNDHWGITYTPYQPTNGQCKSAGEVDKDIAKLKQGGFQVVRIYSTDCNTLETVGPACKKHGLKMIVGVFVKGGGKCAYSNPDIKEQVDRLSQWAQWDMVKLFVAGNEAVMNGFCSPAELRELIITIKSKCGGYKGPYTIAETLNIWQRTDVKSAICDVVGVIGANMHPYFNAEVTPESAGDFVANQLDILGKICPGKQPINLECGWPTKGNCNGKACPGKTQQLQAIQSIRKKCGDKTVFFSYENDEWKHPGSCNCEQSWGSAAAFAL